VAAFAALHLNRSTLSAAGFPPGQFGVLMKTNYEKDTCHLSTDLAWLWPMWGDAADEYADYCRHVTGLVEQHAERPAVTLLDIGYGGGKNVFSLKGKFSVTGVDLSPTMLAQARDLNPESTFVHGGRSGSGRRSMRS
jgi:SAM-dependent methyltransferase